MRSANLCVLHGLLMRGAQFRAFTLRQHLPASAWRDSALFLRLRAGRNEQSTSDCDAEQSDHSFHPVKF